MNCVDIVRDWLTEHGYTGLVCQEVPCGCGLDDLQPCGEAFDLCEPAYAVLCDGTNCAGGCEAKPYPLPDGWETVCFVAATAIHATHTPTMEGED